eukprot:m.228473 g.228473  ORF g.228473 m.228473 type:complete len:105 (-) comp10856_c0_seq18:1861-2175(-)
MAGIGPELPPHLQAARAAATEDDDANAAEAIGPALPPGFERRPRSPSPGGEDSIGPALPPPGGREDESESDDDFGPALPTESDVQTTQVLCRYTRLLGLWASVC